jgi:DNA invertase Pin-like site-specific DNA recombinase
MYRKIPDREKLKAAAASLAAEDELSDNEIARFCGITRRTLIRWKKAGRGSAENVRILSAE